MNVEQFWLACQSPYYLCLGLLLLGLCVWLWLRLRCRRASIKLFQEESSRVRITKNALESLIASICAENGIPGRPKMAFRIANEQLRVRLSIKLPAGSSARELSNHLSNNILDVLRVNLGPDAIADLDLLIIGFSKETKPHPGIAPLMGSLDSQERAEER